MLYNFKRLYVPALCMAITLISPSIAHLSASTATPSATTASSCVAPAGVVCGEVKTCYGSKFKSCILSEDFNLNDKKICDKGKQYSLKSDGTHRCTK